MRERLADLLGVEGADAWVQTFHAFGARFLRREAARAGLPPSFAIYDDDDQKRLVKRILSDMGISDDGRFGPRDVLSRIDRWKNLGHSPSSVRFEDHDVETERSLEVWRRYEKALARAGAVDFGDLLLRPAQLLEADAELAARWATRFRHVLVDEFQDTNPAQYRLAAAALRGAEERLRGGRRRPGHLPLARRRRGQHPRLRPGLPRYTGGEAGAELPLHRRTCSRRPTRSSPGPAGGARRSSGPRARPGRRSPCSSPRTSTRRRSASPRRWRRSATGARAATRSRCSTG